MKLVSFHMHNHGSLVVKIIPKTIKLDLPSVHQESLVNLRKNSK